MKTSRRYAVITGDLIGSSKFTHEERESLLNEMHKLFQLIETELLPQNIITYPFETYRGDSFQCVLQGPEHALRVALTIRSGLRSLSWKNNKEIDARISIGIGNIDYFPSSNKVTEGDGEAFHNSGRALDEMKKENKKIVIVTEDMELNRSLEVQCSLLDALSEYWSQEQWQAIYGKLRGLKQKEMAKEYFASQPAISQRLKAAKYNAIEKYLNYYKSLYKQIQ